MSRERVTKLPQSNIFNASTEEFRALFDDYLKGNAACPVLVVSERPLSPIAHDALAKSFDSFGYGAHACLYATLTLESDGADAVSAPLDSQALFLMIEGLDPVCVVCADETAARALSQTYRSAFDLDSACRVFGRPGVAFRDFEGMLETDAGKQAAWHLLKSLPKR